MNQYTDSIPAGNVVLLFSAAWCGPCRVLKPRVQDALEGQEQWIVGVQVDIDKEPDLVKQFNIMSVPTMLMLQDGEEKGRFIGAPAGIAALTEFVWHT
jgi:thioredoxin-like negative regulator of GroEL